MHCGCSCMQSFRILGWRRPWSLITVLTSKPNWQFLHVKFWRARGHPIDRHRGECLFSCFCLVLNIILSSEILQAAVTKYCQDHATPGPTTYFSSAALFHLLARGYSGRSAAAYVVLFYVHLITLCRLLFFDTKLLLGEQQSEPCNCILFLVKSAGYKW